MKVDHGGRLGRYVLKHEVASGGMATVYLAQTESVGGFERWFAVKVIHSHLAKDRRFTDMFLDEARVTSRLRHPNICSIIEFGEDVAPHIVMEYLHGETLASVIRHGYRAKNLPFWLGARIVGDVSRGLHAAHELTDHEGKPLNLVHRDVSPQNIMVLYDGMAKILDFGIARARGRLTQTEAQEVKGKIAYMSPEQLHGQPIDRRSDVWSLGVVLWESTVGARLFRGDTEGQTTLNVIHKDIPRPTQIVPGYPKALEAVIMSALERDPEKRTKTAAAIADAVDEALYSVGKPTGSPQVSAWMNKIFAEKRAAREKLLQSPPTVGFVSGEAASPSASSAMQSLIPGENSGTRSSPGGAAEDAADNRRKKPLIAVGGGAVGLLVVAGALWAWSGGHEPSAPAPTETQKNNVPVPALRPGGTILKTGDDTPAPTPEQPSTATGSAENQAPAAASGEEAPVEGAATAPENVGTTTKIKHGGTRPGIKRPQAQPKVSETPKETAQPAAAAPEPEGDGKLNVMVMVDDDVDVIIDGKIVGNDTVIKTLGSGIHKVAVKSKADGRVKSAEVKVEAGKTSKFVVTSFD